MISSAVTLSLVFLSTLLVLLYINTERKAFAKRAQIHINAKQSVHTTPTPRVGGLAIAVGILSGALLSGEDLFAALLWSVLPIFIVGLLEDLGPQTPPARSPMQGRTMRPHGGSPQTPCFRRASLPRHAAPPSGPCPSIRNQSPTGYSPQRCSSGPRTPLRQWSP